MWSLRDLCRDSVTFPLRQMAKFHVLFLSNDWCFLLILASWLWVKVTCFTLGLVHLIANEKNYQSNLFLLAMSQSEDDKLEQGGQTAYKGRYYEQETNFCLLCLQPLRLFSLCFWWLVLLFWQSLSILVHKCTITVSDNWSKHIL